MPNVKHILLSYYKDSRAEFLEDSEQKIHYENIESFTVVSNIKKFAFSFENLKHITLGYIKSEAIDAFCEFINSIGHLQTLKIIRVYFTSDELRKVLGLKTIQSNIVEMQFEYITHMSTDEIIRFVNQSHKLRKLTIHQKILFHDRNYIPSLVETISSNLNVEWKIYNMNPPKDPFDETWRGIYTCCVIERIID